MRIEKSLRNLRMKSLGLVTDFKFNQFIIPEHLKEALNKTLIENKTLYLEGESGTGKTKMLEGYFEYKGMNPLIINNYDGLKFFREEIHDCILMDDITFKGLSRETIIKILDSTSNTTFRVTQGTISIPKNIPRYICSNLPLKKIIGSLKIEKAFTRRIKEINIGGLLLYKTT